MVADPATTIRFLLASRQCELSSLHEFLQDGELVGRISELVHELQRERGTSNMFLFSDGRYFADELLQREQDVRQAEARAMAQLGGLEQRSAASLQASRLFSRAASVVYTLSQLPALRQRIRRRTLPQQAAMSAFNEIIRHLLTLVFELADRVAEPTIARALIAMFSFMQGKELAGQERALGAAAFASGEFDQQTQRAMLDLIARQERCFDIFSDFADEENRARWRALGTESEFERLRRVACTAPLKSPLAPDGSLRWFALSTARIDAMKQIEDGLAQTLMRRCGERIAAAQQEGSDQLADIDALLAQRRGDDHGYSVFIPAPQGEGMAGDHLWLNSDGLRPQLGRSLLELSQQQARRLQQQDHELAEMRETLNERNQVDRAKRLLMQHRGLSEDEAHRTLRRMAMNQNKKLIEIASAMLSVADIFQDQR